MNHTVITIGRQFGSRGRDIGKLVADHLDIPFFDKEIIEIASTKSGINENYLHSLDEKPSSSFLYSLSMGTYPLNTVAATPDLPMNDKLFLLQSEIIKDLALKGPCVIVGRCSEYVLRDDPNLLSVFIHTDFNQRVKWIMERENLPLQKATEVVKKIDKRRNSYYSMFTHEKWGDRKNYDLCLNSSIGVELCAKIIECAAKNK